MILLALNLWQSCCRSDTSPSTIDLFTGNVNTRSMELRKLFLHKFCVCEYRHNGKIVILRSILYIYQLKHRCSVMQCIIRTCIIFVIKGTATALVIPCDIYFCIPYTVCIQHPCNSLINTISLKFDFGSFSNGVVRSILVHKFVQPLL
jgi:hypothetical protein